MNCGTASCRSLLLNKNHITNRNYKSMNPNPKHKKKKKKKELKVATVVELNLRSRCLWPLFRCIHLSISHDSNSPPKAIYQANLQQKGYNSIQFLLETSLLKSLKKLCTAFHSNLENHMQWKLNQISNNSTKYRRSVDFHFERKRNRSESGCVEKEDPVIGGQNENPS